MNGEHYPIRIDHLFLEIAKHVVQAFKPTMNKHGYTEYKSQGQVEIPPIQGCHKLHLELMKCIHTTNGRDVLKQKVGKWLDSNVLDHYTLSIEQKTPASMIYCDDILIREENDAFWSLGYTCLDMSDWSLLSKEEQLQVLTWLQSKKNSINIWIQPSIIFGPSLVCPHHEKSMYFTPFTPTSSSTASTPLLIVIYWMICYTIDYRKEVSDFRKTVLHKRMKSIKSNQEATYGLSPRWILCSSLGETFDLTKHKVDWHTMF